MTRAPLLSIAVRRLLVVAVLLAALGAGARAVAPTYAAAGIWLASGAILVAGTALVLLWSRRGFDRLERTPAIAAIVIAAATALGTAGIVLLLNDGPDRPIGVIGSVAAVGVVGAASAAAAAAAILIRAHVEAFAAHVWAGIGGAGLAVPFMVAGAPPEAITAAAVGLAILDRRGFVRQRAELEQREARLRGEAVVDPPRWSAAERRSAVLSGAVAIGLVVVAWGGGIAVSTLAGGASGADWTGQGFALAALAAAPLALQAAQLRGVERQVRPALVAATGMLVAAAIAIAAAPVDAVFFAALAMQSAAAALLAAALASRRAPSNAEGSNAAVSAGARSGGARSGGAQSPGALERALTAGLLAAVGWWLLVVPTGGLALGVLALGTTIAAATRRATRRASE